MPAPPGARDGGAAHSKNRPVIAGVAPFERSLPGDPSLEQVWAVLRTFKTDIGLRRLEQLHGRSFTDETAYRIVAFLEQSESFFHSSRVLAPASSPLVAYYATLNLAKAFLTCKSPGLTSGFIRHGLSDAFESMQRYWFAQERVRVRADGVFRELATRTGGEYCYPSGEVLQIQRLAPYLAETSELFRDATGRLPKLLPITSLEVMVDESHIWLRAEVDRDQLILRELSPTSLLRNAGHFAREFRLVQSDTPTASYESKTPIAYRRQLASFLPRLVESFERSLIHTIRTPSQHRHYVVLSTRRHLLSQEAVTFLTIHHLSNMVRYRPEQVAKLVASEWFFLFETWLPRALENLTLALTSRLLHEEVRIA